MILLPGQNTYTGPVTITYGSGGAFAYQAIAGASMPVGLVPGFEATLEYRFFGTARTDIRGTATAPATNTINGAVPSGSNRKGYLLTDNALLFGLRYHF